MQRIVVFQQGDSGEPKIRGILSHGKGIRISQVVTLNPSLPLVIDDPEEYLPQDIDADLVLDFMRHPDLSIALAEMCRTKGIPVVASGKKIRVEGTLTPPT